MNQLPDGTPTEPWLDPADDNFFARPNIAERNIRRAQLPADRLLPTLQQLRDSALQTGWWPVLVGRPEQSEYVRGQCFLEVEPARPVADVLAEANAIDPTDWFKGREERWRDLCGQYPRLQQHFEELTQTANQWPKDTNPPAKRLSEDSCVKHWTDDGPEVVLLVPCSEPWEVPAHLNFGNWNDCPHPAEHSAIWRYWHERWGATILAVGESPLCGIASCLPAERIEAIELAWQHFFYDNDVMNLDDAFTAKTIPALAQIRMTYPVWMFWWD